MPVSAHNPASARKQRIQSPSLVIIEFVLDSLSHVGTAGQLLHLLLMQGYVAVPHRLHHKMIPFNIGSLGDLGKHASHMAKIVQELQKGYVVQ